MGRLKVLDLWKTIADDAKTTVNSSMEEKLWVAKQTLLVLRSQLEAHGTIDESRYVIFTRLRASSFYCEGCKESDMWQWTLYVINDEDDSRVTVDAFWHQEKTVQVQIRGELPHRRDTSTWLMNRVLALL